MAATRVMLVDDAVVVRHILRDALGKDPDIDVVGTAPNGLRALEQIPLLKPDVIVLDVEMPEMDGIETLAAVKASHPHIKVIMFSTLTSHGARATIDALMVGAEDYVTKPANVGSVSAAIERIHVELLPKIKALHRASSVVRPIGTPAARFGAVVKPSTKPGGSVRAVRTRQADVVVIAVSTGGPNALNTLIPALPAHFPVPVLIVQHIPATFSEALAQRLDNTSAINVRHCVDGATPRPGEVWLAAGDHHMTVERRGTRSSARYEPGTTGDSCRPAADVLFRSALSVYGPATLGVVLTGMGYDGLKGSEQIVAAGGTVIAQDEATSVVWGMPGAVVEKKLAADVQPLDNMAAAIITNVRPAGLVTSRHGGTVRSSEGK